MIRRFVDWLRAYQCSMCGTLTHEGVIRGHDPKTERPIFVCAWCGAADAAKKSAGGDTAPSPASEVAQ